MAGIEIGSLNEPHETVEFGDQGRSDKVTLGIAGYGVGSESTVWLSTLHPGWSLRFVRSSGRKSTTRASTSRSTAPRRTRAMT